MKHYIILWVKVRGPLWDTNDPAWLKFRDTLINLRRQNGSQGPLTAMELILDSKRLAENVWLLPDNPEMRGFMQDFKHAADKERLEYHTKEFQEEEQRGQKEITGR